MAKTSLEKSHSKASNAKLTFVCLLATISVSFLWVGIALVVNNPLFGGIVLGLGALATLFSLLLISRFTR